MIDVSTTARINVPREEVWNYLIRLDRSPEWYENIRKVEVLQKPVKKGTEAEFTAHFMGKKLVYTYKVKEFIPKKRLTMSTIEGPFPMKTTYLLEKQELSTDVTIRNKGTPKGFSKLMSPMISYMVRRANKKDLKRLKQVLEQH